MKAYTIIVFLTVCIIPYICGINDQRIESFRIDSDQELVKSENQKRILSSDDSYSFYFQGSNLFLHHNSIKERIDAKDIEIFNLNKKISIVVRQIFIDSSGKISFENDVRSSGTIKEMADYFNINLNDIRYNPHSLRTNCVISFSCLNGDRFFTYYLSDPDNIYMFENAYGTDWHAGVLNNINCPTELSGKVDLGDGIILGFNTHVAYDNNHQIVDYSKETFLSDAEDTTIPGDMFGKNIVCIRDNIPYSLFSKQGRQIAFHKYKKERLEKDITDCFDWTSIIHEYIHNPVRARQLYQAGASYNISATIEKIEINTDSSRDYKYRFYAFDTYEDSILVGYTNDNLLVNQSLPCKAYLKGVLEGYWNGYDGLFISYDSGIRFVNVEVLCTHHED